MLRRRLAIVIVTLLLAVGAGALIYAWHRPHDKQDHAAQRVAVESVKNAAKVALHAEPAHSADAAADAGRAFSESGAGLADDAAQAVHSPPSASTPGGPRIWLDGKPVEITDASGFADDAGRGMHHATGLTDEAAHGASGLMGVADDAARGAGHAAAAAGQAGRGAGHLVGVADDVGRGVVSFGDDVARGSMSLLKYIFGGGAAAAGGIIAARRRRKRNE